MAKKILLTGLVLLGFVFSEAKVCFADAAALLEQAKTYVNTGWRQQAQQSYETIVTDYPGSSYYDDGDWPEDPDNMYDTDMTGFNDLLAGLPGPNNRCSFIKAGCIVPGDDVQYPYTIADVLPYGFFEPEPVPDYVEPEDRPVGISIAECDREPTGDELIEHFHRIREGVVPDCIIRLADNSGSMDGFSGLGDGYKYEFVPWLEDWLEGHGLDPDDTDILPEEIQFCSLDWCERWIHEITFQVDKIINP